MGPRRWGRRRSKKDVQPEAPRSRRSSGDDDHVDLDDDVDSWWTGRGAEEAASPQTSDLGPRTAEEVREAFKRKRRKPESAGKSGGAFSDYYSADSLFTTVTDESADGELFDPDDPYVVLGVPATSTWEQITAAHRRLARLHHPDRVQGAPDEEQRKSADRMSAVNLAYAELRRRRKA